MSGVDLHPEELLDRARRGQLDDADERRLRLHLEHCTACAFELKVSEDFDWDGIPSSGDEDLLARVTAGALGEPGRATRFDRREASVPIGFGRGAVVAPPRKRGRTRDWQWPAVAAAAMVLLFVVGAGGATAWWVATTVLFPKSAPAKTDAPAADGPIEGRSSEHARPRRRRDGVLVLTGDPTVIEHFRARRRRVARAEPVVVAPAPEPTPAPVVIAPTAPELLARADQARRSGQISEAAGLYRELQTQFPSSREQRVSRVSFGRLLLDRLGDARGALQQFDEYLSRRGDETLAEEARVGRALAFERLGRRDDARHAWQELLDHHPTSPHAPRARQRITALSTRR